MKLLGLGATFAFLLACQPVDRVNMGPDDRLITAGGSGATGQGSEVGSAPVTATGGATNQGGTTSTSAGGAIIQGGTPSASEGGAAGNTTTLSVSVGGKPSTTLNLEGLTAVTVTDYVNGFVMPLPESDPCSLDRDVVSSLDTVSNTLSWERCETDPVAGGAIRPTHSRELTDYEMNAARLMLRRLSSSRDLCGNDASDVTLDLHFGERVDAYVDDFYAGCPQRPFPERTPIAGVWGIAGWLDYLSRNSTVPAEASSLTLWEAKPDAELDAAIQGCSYTNDEYTVDYTLGTIVATTCTKGTSGYEQQSFTLDSTMWTSNDRSSLAEATRNLRLGATGNCTAPVPNVYLILYAKGRETETQYNQYVNDSAACDPSPDASGGIYAVGIDALAQLIKGIVERAR